MPTGTTSAMDPSGALNRLARREEILQICYWFQGEGFGDCFTAESIKTFLTCASEEIVEALEGLVADGALVRDAAAYRFSSDGKKKAGHLFHESFADFQIGTHGECSAGCCESKEERGRDHTGEPV